MLFFGSNREELLQASKRRFEHRVCIEYPRTSFRGEHKADDDRKTEQLHGVSVLFIVHMQHCTILYTV